MEWHTATKKQLIQICINEDCSFEDKYEAARELQLRQWRDEYLTDLVRLWGEGKSSPQIAWELGIDKQAVAWQLEKYELYGSRIAK
jgi:hypothetical protein